MNKVRPKKHLGQHFLNDENIAKNIAESLMIDKPVDVLEIGPGMGVLTKYLLQNPNINLKVVELDNESVEYLRDNYPVLNENIISADFLKLNLKDVFSGQFFIIGNFPYNISSQIFFKMLDNKNQIPQLSGMIQKEVAERIAAKPGSKTYGILSVLLQAYYDIEYLFMVHEHVFMPPPKVKSAVIRMTRNELQTLDCNEVLFKTVVKTAFNQRRKQMRNSLKSLIEKESEILSNPIFDKRPEQLSVAQFVKLTNLIEGNCGSSPQ